jgi:hypothetical protein
LPPNAASAQCIAITANADVPACCVQRVGLVNRVNTHNAGGIKSWLLDHNAPCGATATVVNRHPLAARARLRTIAKHACPLARPSGDDVIDESDSMAEARIRAPESIALEAGTYMAIGPLSIVEEVSKITDENQSMPYKLGGGTLMPIPDTIIARAPEGQVVRRMCRHVMIGVTSGRIEREGLNHDTLIDCRLDEQATAREDGGVKQVGTGRNAQGAARFSHRQRRGELTPCLHRLFERRWKARAESIKTSGRDEEALCQRTRILMQS